MCVVSTTTDVELADASVFKRKVEMQVPITFTDLTYSVQIKKETKVILNGLDGCFMPGRMCALFGPSGCGKSSLMDVLSGRKNSGTIGGTIRFDGAAVKQCDLKHICGYVEQFDNLVEDLTVEQMLMYTAELKLPKLPTAEKEARVEEVIKLLQLQSCRGTIIGGALVKGISGGQKKRVNIGLALITRPPILFLDEPTTGLDSAMADEVVGIMSFLASQGRTVVATVHSPTASAFSLFDDLVMLREGQLVYAGPCGDAASSYFEKEVGLRPLELGESLPEWLVDTTSSHEVNEVLLSERAKLLHQKRLAGRGGHEASELSADGLAKTYKASAVFGEMSARRNELHGDGSKPCVKVPAHLRRANPFQCVWILLKYRADEQLRRVEVALCPRRIRRRRRSGGHPVAAAALALVASSVQRAARRQDGGRHRRCGGGEGGGRGQDGGRPQRGGGEARLAERCVEAGGIAGLSSRQEA